MKVALFLHRAADATLTGVEELNRFLFTLLARAIQPVVALGLMYWVATNLAGYSINMFPWWGLTWAIIQAIAITTHLGTLPPRAIEQARNGERASLALTIISIVLLAISSIPFMGLGLGSIPALNTLRILALVSILFTEPVAAEPRHLAIIVPLTESGIPVSGEYDQPIYNTQYRQD